MESGLYYEYDREVLDFLEEFGKILDSDSAYDSDDYSSTEYEFEHDGKMYTITYFSNYEWKEYGFYCSDEAWDAINAIVKNNN